MFLKGFREAIGLAVVIVVAYLALNVVVLAVAFYELFVHHPEAVRRLAGGAVRHARRARWRMLGGRRCSLFPKLALGLSGFETGRRRDAAGAAATPDDDPGAPAGRIRNTRSCC